MTASEAKVDARLANFDTTMKTGFAELRAEIHKTAADLLKWGAGIAFAAVASTVGLLSYLNKAGEKPAAPPQAPIIINVPAAPSVPSGAPQAAPQPGR